MLVLWLAALLSAMAGAQPVAPLDIGEAGHAISDAARSGETPAQQSTAPSLQARLALLSERAIEAASSPGFDGPDSAVLPHLGLAVPLQRAALGDRPAASLAPPAGPVDVRARAPPILA